MAMAAGRSNTLPAVCLDEPHQLSYFLSILEQLRRLPSHRLLQHKGHYVWPIERSNQTFTSMGVSM